MGAIWVDPGDLEDLNENEYRNPDPPKFFPGVEEGPSRRTPWIPMRGTILNQ